MKSFWLKVKFTFVFLGLIVISPLLFLADMSYSVATCIKHFGQELWDDTKYNWKQFITANTTSVKMLRMMPKLKLKTENNKNESTD